MTDCLKGGMKNKTEVGSHHIKVKTVEHKVGTSLNLFDAERIILLANCLSISSPQQSLCLPHLDGIAELCFRVDMLWVER